MQASQTPTLVPLAFAANGTKNTIPEASQIGVTPGAASLNDGFPPLTFTPVAAGGVPPAGADFNGVLNLITQSVRWAHGGGRYAFSSTFAADANVSGYPAGAELMSADLQGAWLSLNDSNTDNPDTGAGTKWVPSRAYGVTAVTGLTNANVTLTPAQAAKNRITLAGTLTGNVQIIFPTWLREWTIVNNTTGAFTVTAKTAAGTGIAIPQNGSPTKVVGDGTNITQLAENIAVGTQPQHAVQLGQLTGLVGAVRNLKATVASGATSALITAEQVVVGSALNGIQTLLANFSQTINLGTSGAGGMLSGTATANGFLGIYAIWGTAGTSIGGVMESAAALPTICGVALPNGYSESTLLAVVPISSVAGQFASFSMVDRIVTITENTVISSSTNSTSGPNTAIPMSGVPYSARKISGSISLTNTVAANSIWQFFADANSTGKVQFSINTAANGGNLFGYSSMPLSAARTVRAAAFTSTGSNSFAYILLASSYEI
jgi:hypothetical protein